LINRMARIGGLEAENGIEGWNIIARWREAPCRKRYSLSCLNSRFFKTAQSSYYAH